MTRALMTAARADLFAAGAHVNAAGRIGNTRRRPQTAPADLRPTGPALAF